MKTQSPKQPIDEQENGVLLYEHGPEDGSWLVVADEHHEHFRVTFYWSAEGTVNVGVNAEWSDHRPGELANFTHDIMANCGPNDTLSITDEGLLTVSARHMAASTVDFRSGFTLQLPAAFVPAVRKAIRLARARALMATGSISDERLRELEAAEPDATQQAALLHYERLITADLTPQEKAELIAWERQNVTGSGELSTSDWPGWPAVYKRTAQ